MRGKRFFPLGLCAALVLTMVFASGCGEKAEPAAEGDAAEWKQLVSETDALAEMRKDLAETEKVEYFVKQTALIQEMETFFDQNTPYPVYRIIAACQKAAGAAEKDALAWAESIGIREPAALWYAEEHDIEVSDDMLNKWMEEFGASDDQALYEDACKEAGVSFEVFNRYMQRQYRMLCIMDMAHKADEKVNEEVITAEYKESDAYKTMDRLLKNCEKLYSSDEDSDLEKVLAADIWY